MADERDDITDATKEAEARDAEAEHGAPQVPTAAEAAAADRNGGASRESAQAYEAYLAMAKDTKGEGRIP